MLTFRSTQGTHLPVPIEETSTPYQDYHHSLDLEASFFEDEIISLLSEVKKRTEEAKIGVVKAIEVRAEDFFKKISPTFSLFSE